MEIIIEKITALGLVDKTRKITLPKGRLLIHVGDKQFVVNNTAKLESVNRIDPLKKDKFKLRKSFGEYKKGRVFESFDGLVQGICCDQTNEKINFNDKEYFKLI